MDIAANDTPRGDTANLCRCLADWERRHGASYLTSMWWHVLDTRVQSDRNGGVTGKYNDALPYLPLAPESVGLCITRTTRVLDVGCLGGYGLYDLASRFRQDGREMPEFVGVDVDPDSIDLGVAMSQLWRSGAKVSFYTRQLEELDPDLGQFDIVLCRLVLPYTRIHKAMIALRAYTQDEGVLVLQVHSPLYYINRFVHSLKSPRKMFYYLRPLCNGLLFAVFRLQLHGHLWQETALCRYVMTRLLRSNGFALLAVKGHRRKPIYICKARCANKGA
ncbi:MAG: class I SAM-dependent methyltransferase [Kiritimatiellia bacterium]